MKKPDETETITVSPATRLSGFEAWDVLNNKNARQGLLQLVGLFKHPEAEKLANNQSKFTSQKHHK